MTRPETHYARSGELAIAYQVHGSGDRDLLVNTGTASNIETVWDIPEAARFFERLGGFARVIRFDRRDSGLSDPIRDDLTLEAHADDALAVIEAAGAEHPVLMGSLDGARSLALLAATRPQQVGGLIAISPSTRGGAASSPELAESVEQTLAELTDWPGQQLLAFYVPDWAGDPVRGDRLRRYFQTTVTPRQGARLLRMSLTSDIRDVLPLVQAPTLVLHPPDLQVVSVDAVREFVDLIPARPIGRYPEIHWRHSPSTSRKSPTSLRSSSPGQRPRPRPTESLRPSCSPTWSTRPGVRHKPGTGPGQTCSIAISRTQGLPS